LAARLRDRGAELREAERAAQREPAAHHPQRVDQPRIAQRLGLEAGGGEDPGADHVGDDDRRRGDHADVALQLGVGAPAREPAARLLACGVRNLLKGHPGLYRPGTFLPAPQAAGSGGGDFHDARPRGRRGEIHTASGPPSSDRASALHSPPFQRIQAPIAMKPSPATAWSTRGLTCWEIQPPASTPSAEVSTRAEADARKTTSRGLSARAE